MNNTTLVSLAALMTLASACGGDAAKSNSAASVSRLDEACRNRLEESDAVCSCVADRAQENLSDDGIAFVEAALNEDPDKIRSISRKMDFQETAAASTFLAWSVAECALQASD